MSVPVALETIDENLLHELLAVDLDVTDPVVGAAISELGTFDRIHIPAAVYNASITDTPGPFNNLLITSPVSFQPFIDRRPYSQQDFEYANDGAMTSAGAWMKRYTNSTHWTYERATVEEPTSLSLYTLADFAMRLKADVNMVCAGRDAKRGAAHADVTSVVVAKVAGYLTSTVAGCEQLSTTTLNKVAVLFNRVKRLTKTSERAWRLMMHGFATCPLTVELEDKARCMIGYGLCRYYAATKRPDMTTTGLTAAHLLTENRDYAALLAFPLSAEEWWSAGPLDLLPVEMALWDTVKSGGDKDAHATFVVAYHMSRADQGVDGDFSDRLSELINAYNTMLLTRELTVTTHVASVMNRGAIVSATLEDVTSPFTREEMLERFGTGTETARLQTMKRVAEFLEYEPVMVDAINRLVPVTELAAYSRPGKYVCTSAHASCCWTFASDLFPDKTIELCTAVYGELYNPATLTTGQSLYALLSVCLGTFTRPGSLRMFETYVADVYRRHLGTRNRNNRSNTSSSSSRCNSNLKRKWSAPRVTRAVQIDDDDDELITGNSK